MKHRQTTATVQSKEARERKANVRLTETANGLQGGGGFSLGAQLSPWEQRIKVRPRLALDLNLEPSKGHAQAGADAAALPW